MDTLGTFRKHASGSHRDDCCDGQIRDLSIDELACVGGAASKEMPKESISLSYGGIQVTYSAR